MAKMKITPDSVSVVKKTLTMSAPTGVTPTPDSTAYFRDLANSKTDEFTNLYNQKVKELKKLGDTQAEISALQDPKVKMLLTATQKAAMSRDRQANKGKEGFDKNGYPLPKVSEKQKAAVASKLTGK